MTRFFLPTHKEPPITPKQFFEFAKKHKSDMVDLKFTDTLGTWQHCSFPIETWIHYKVQNELRELPLRPHPYEFFLYYDS